MSRVLAPFACPGPNRGHSYNADSVKRPQYFGTLTNDIVWKRIAPGVAKELKRVIPKNAKGRRKATLSQALTRNIGYPKLREHLGATVAYMTVSPDYPTFIKTLDAHRPRFHDQLELPFEYRPDEDDGKRLADPLVRSMTGACKAGLGSTRCRYDYRRQNGRPIGRLEGEPRQSA
jgi:hypothetical protein